MTCLGKLFRSRSLIVFCIPNNILRANDDAAFRFGKEPAERVVVDVKLWVVGAMIDHIQVILVPMIRRLFPFIFRQFDGSFERPAFDFDYRSSAFGRFESRSNPFRNIGSETSVHVAPKRFS